MSLQNYDHSFYTEAHSHQYEMIRSVMFSVNGCLFPHYFAANYLHRNTLYLHISFSSRINVRITQSLFVGNLSKVCNRSCQLCRQRLETIKTMLQQLYMLLTHFRMRCITTVSYVEANIDIGQKNGFPFSFLHLCLFHKQIVSSVRNFFKNVKCVTVADRRQQVKHRSK